MMKELANKIQVVMNTLQLLDIPASYDNVSRLTGIYQMLVGVRDELNGKDETVVNEDGTV